MNGRELEIEDDPEVHRRTWRIQRTGWAGLALLLLASSLGVFGNGPVASVQVNTSEGATVEYRRFLTRSAISDLRVAMPAGAAWVQVSRSFLDAVQLDRILPEPATSFPVDDGLRFTFRPAPAPIHARFTYRADAIGRVRGAVAIDRGGTAEIRQFFFP